MEPNAPVNLVRLFLAAILLLKRQEWRQFDGSDRHDLEDNESRPIGKSVEHQLKNGSDDDVDYDFN